MSATQLQAGRSNGSFGEFLWWLFKGAFAVLIGIYTVYLYSWNSWISTHHVAGQSNEYSGGLFGNIFGSWIHSWSYLVAGQVGSFLVLFFAPLLLLSTFIGLVSSLKQKS